MGELTLAIGLEAMYQQARSVLFLRGVLLQRKAFLTSVIPCMAQPEALLRAWQYGLAIGLVVPVQQQAPGNGRVYAR